jgi:transposase-like protein
MKTNTNNYRGYRFPREIISHSVWLCHRFSLSFRDVEELLAKRGIVVSYETGVLVGPEAAHLAAHDFLLHLGRSWSMP